MPYFTEEQIKDWHDNGFLILSAANERRMFTDEEVDQLLNYTKEVEDWPETPGKWMKYFEKSLVDDSRILQRIENFFQFHEGFNNFFNGPKFLGMVSELFGEPACLFKEKVNMKLPGGGGFAPHQDVQAGWDMYGQTLHISVLVGLDPSTTQNGCLELVPAYHKKGLLGPMGSQIPEDVCAAMPWKPYPAAPGDIIFFDSYVPHRSGPNNTDKPRRALYITYNKISEGDYRFKYWEDKRKSFPPDIEREPGREYKYKI